MRDLYKPYIRRSNGREYTCDHTIAIWHHFYKRRGKPFYVLVQRGKPNQIFSCGTSKRDIVGSIVLARKIGYKDWTNRIKRLVQSEAEITAEDIELERTADWSAVKQGRK